MKKMKKTIINVFSVFVLICLSLTTVKANSMSITANKSQVSPNSTVTFTITPPSNHVADVNLSVSNGTIESTNGCYGTKCVILAGRSSQVTVKAGSEGSVTLSASGKVSKLGSDTASETSGSASVKITAPAASNPTPNLPNPGVDDPSRPDRRKPEQHKETEAERKARLEKEKKLEEERLKAEEERKKKELEEKKKTPLVTEIEFISKSDKLKGESIHKLETKKDVFEYEYVLPRRIDQFEIKPIAGKDVKLEFVKEHTLDADKKEIIIKAHSGEIKQDIKLVVKKNNEKLLSKKVNDESYQVYEDELLTRFMDKFGFESKKDEKIGQYFVKNKINLQMLVDEDKNVHWVLLDDKLNFKDFVSPIFLKDQVFFVKEAPEETQQETLYGEKYQKTQRKVSSEFAKIDPELKYEYDYKSWPFHDGEIVYGFDESMNEDFYRFDNDSYKVAAVAFDMENTKWKRVAMVSGFGFLGLASTNAVSIYKKKKRV